MRFEYKIKSWEDPIDFSLSKETARGRLVDRFNELGQDGWELVHFNAEAFNFITIWKRQRE